MIVLFICKLSICKFAICMYVLWTNVYKKFNCKHKRNVIKCITFDAGVDVMLSRTFRLMEFIRLNHIFPLDRCHWTHYNAIGLLKIAIYETSWVMFVQFSKRSSDHITKHTHSESVTDLFIGLDEGQIWSCLWMAVSLFKFSEIIIPQWHAMIAIVYGAFIIWKIRNINIWNWNSHLINKCNNVISINAAANMIIAL